MREIKFRAWDLEAEKMMPLGYFQFDNQGAVQGVQCFLETKKGELPIFRPNGEDLVLMQYTGLKDKNGKDVYEGDIVRLNKNIYEVQWNETQAIGFSYRDEANYFSGMMERTDKTEIIGNIYENPDLLK